MARPLGADLDGLLRGESSTFDMRGRRLVHSAAQKDPVPLEYAVPRIPLSEGHRAVVGHVIGHGTILGERNDEKEFLSPVHQAHLASFTKSQIQNPAKAPREPAGAVSNRLGIEPIRRQVGRKKAQ